MWCYEDLPRMINCTSSNHFCLLVCRERRSRLSNFTLNDRTPFWRTTRADLRFDVKQRPRRERRQTRTTPHGPQGDHCAFHRETESNDLFSRNCPSRQDSHLPAFVTITTSRIANIVQQGDFTIQLVEAHSKTPFMEHDHDGKTYVEVEPDAEYFVSTAKTGANEFLQHAMLMAVIYVDGKSLGYASVYDPNQRYEPACKGKWVCENGISSDTALKFAVPAIRGGAMPVTDFNTFGRVDVRIFEGLNPRPEVRLAFKALEMEAFVPASVGNGKKTVRSTEGPVETDAKTIGTTYIHNDEGALLSAIT